MTYEQTPVTDAELTAFFDALNAVYTAHYRAQYPDCDLNWYSLKLVKGQRYAKLVSVQPGSVGGSSHSFIDLTNGDILKAASWKAPAKHARGNIRMGDASNRWNGTFGGPTFCVRYL